MIPVRLDDIPLLYVFLAVGVILISWLLVILAARRREANARRGAIRCAACGTVFANTASQNLPVCPTCGQSNERIPATFF